MREMWERTQCSQQTPVHGKETPSTTVKSGALKGQDSQAQVLGGEDSLLSVKSRSAARKAIDDAALRAYSLANDDMHEQSSLLAGTTSKRLADTTPSHAHRTSPNLRGPTTRLGSLRSANAQDNREGQSQMAGGSLVAEKWSKIHRPPRWEQPLVYPTSGPKRTTVEFDDLSRLDDGEFLNDNLISFYLRFVSQKAPHLEKDVYFFNTYFYTTLTTTSKGTKGFNFAAVEKWTSKVDIFNYKFLVVPINEDIHWYVAVICNPARMAKSCDADTCDDDNHTLVSTPPAAPREKSPVESEQQQRRLDLSMSDELTGSFPTLTLADGGSGLLPDVGQDVSAKPLEDVTDDWPAEDDDLEAGDRNAVAKSPFSKQARLEADKDYGRLDSKVDSQSLRSPRSPGSPPSAKSEKKAAASTPRKQSIDE